MSRVALEGISKRFGDVVAVDDLTLEIADKEFLVLLGPSGCGKSTALRMIAGLEEPRHRHGLPELRALSAHDRGAEHRVPPEVTRRAEGRAREGRRRGGADAGARGASQEEAGRALGRPAATSRIGTRGGTPTRGV